MTVFFPLLQLAEVKVQIMEAKQTLEDYITAQDFSRAAELKDSMMELENRRNQILQEIAESNQPADKETHTEKVESLTGCTWSVFVSIAAFWTSFFPLLSFRMTQRLYWDV